MDLLTLDRVLAVAGFVVAIWQIVKTRASAEAARTAAASAIVAIRRLEAATKMHDIASRSRELLRLLRTKTLAPAASAAFELRDTVARYRHDHQARRLVSEDEWLKAVTDVRILHERLESLGMTTKTSTQDREALLHEVGRLHTLFTEIAARASVEGAIDAYSE